MFWQFTRIIACHTSAMQKIYLLRCEGQNSTPIFWILGALARPSAWQAPLMLLQDKLP
jgi:hypothetical protein